MIQGNGSLRVGDASFWYQDIGLPDEIRPSLDRNRNVDVAIVGAGYTGLWSAYYLKKANPKLNIIVVEKEFSGFGASGRNGGWLTSGFAWVNRKVKKWVPEPFRWLGVHGMYALLRISDERETRLGISPSRFGSLGKWLTGK